MPMSDQEMMAAARRQLHSELSYVLEIEESQVLPFVMEQVRQVQEEQERQDSMESDAGNEL